MQEHTPSVLITSCGKGGIGHALAVEFQNQGKQCASTRLIPAPPYLLYSYTMTGIDTDVREVEKMFGVNVFGPMRMVHIFHPLLIRAQGKIVNIRSVGGIVSYVYGSSYNASKAALHHWGNTLRVELKPLGVDVVNIISGEISTNILKRDQGRRLPDDSFYRPLAREFEDHAASKTNISGTRLQESSKITLVKPFASVSAIVLLTEFPTPQNDASWALDESPLRNMIGHVVEKSTLPPRVGCCLAMAGGHQPGYGILVEADRPTYIPYDAGGWLYQRRTV
ncbi:hypothetical protein PENCOP_c012G02972 [Penicillium coprophilum]|uniref:NAD(P)-binding protein n=1 Tax=Penicillium coprophilum TaxID=36646 RepID=A0A1V6UE59_9EURO|nr:hypothetical protein PENCOP_c012G02972 [Penicillium coprophilum]